MHASPALCRAIAGLTVVLAPSSAEPAWGQELPVVERVASPALRVGEFQELTMHGRSLQEVTGLLADIPLEVEILGRSPRQSTFRVKAAAPAWLGLHQLRVTAPGSVSAPRLFLLDELPLVRQQAGNHSLAEAQTVPVPATLLGHTERGKVDYYQFLLDAPARLTFEIVARRLGTGPDVKLEGDEIARLLTIDPVLRLLDSAGRTLAVMDDTPGLTADFRFRHQFEQAGRYVVAIHDVQYGGGPEHQYALRIGDFPDAAVCYPASGLRDRENTSVRLFGLDDSTATLGGEGQGAVEESGGYEPADVYADGAALDSVRWISARSASGLGSLAVPHLVGRFPDIREMEPNDAPDVAVVAPLPSACHGRLQTPGDVDLFAVDLEMGQKVRVSTTARAVGSTVCAAVQVLGPDGMQVAATVHTVDEKAHAEGSGPDPRLDPPSVTFESVASGRHLIRVHRRVGREGPAAVYRLEIEPLAGDVALRASTDFLAVPLGGRAVFPVQVLRDQYDGPLELTATSTMVGVAASATPVPGPQVPRPVVVLMAPVDAPRPPVSEGGGQIGAAGWFVVTVRARIGGHEIHRVADLTSLYDAPPNLKGPDKLRPYYQGLFFFLRPLPPIVTRRIALLVTDPAPFAIESPVECMTQAAGQSITVSVLCRRSNGFGDAVALRVEGLPETFLEGSEVPAISDGSDSSIVQLNIPADADAGRYAFALVGEATVEGRTRSNATSMLVLEVAAAPGK